MMKKPVLAGLALLLAAALPARAADPQVVEVAPKVYALVGELGQRSASNLGNNATFGAVVTAAGVVLVDPGGSAAGAQAIERALATVTDQPVVLVINTGGQDHRWLGNAWFKAKGARIVASAAAVTDQRARADMQFEILRSLLGDAFAGTEAVHAAETFDDRKTIEIGGARLELIKVGPAHTPGDTIVHLPAAGVVFSGDVVYLDRMLGVMPQSNSRSWVAAFETLAGLAPKVIVPGHGKPGDLAQAAAQTLGYLQHLRKEIRALLDAGGDMQAAAGIDQGKYMGLASAESLAGRNAEQVFAEMEFE